ncbi:MAG: DRTGG domain-containing protein [Oscillospiraceae bacterium]|nr:DRTGG domain-containing protein [Oscillospiraceae bacterium]
MTVQELSRRLALTEFHLAEGGRSVTSAYCGDLLSWVMGRAPADGAWLTIMSNMNVAAVAALTDVACVILTEGVQPDPQLLSKAQAQGVNLLGSGLSTYDCALALSGQLS